MSGGDWKDMFQAAQTGDVGLVEYYLKSGIDPNYQHPEFMASALIESIRFDHFNVTKLLLEKGADPTIIEDMDGDTPLSVAKSKRNQATIDLLNSYIQKIE